MIVLRDLSKSFDGRTTFAVHNLSLEVQEGETLVLLGSSGCGKTTTLKMINRLIEPTSGEIEVDGVNVLQKDVVELRRSIGYVFQSIGLFPHMTIEENVTIVPRLLGWSEEQKQNRAKELLALVQLDPDQYASRYPHELSGGQQQRVGVARALAADPDYLLMDEPFGALDPITREAVQEEFAQLEAIIQKTIVFVTHDVFEAVTLGDRIAIMEAGEIVQLGTPTELLTQPANVFVSDFFSKHHFQLQFNALSVRDFIRLDAGVQTTVDSTAVSVSPMDNLGGAVDLMRKHQLSELPVVDGQVVGVLRSTDLVEALVGQRDQSYGRE